MCEGMSDKELITTTINKYCDLQRIKKFSQDENPELEFQLKKTRAELTVYGINVEELAY